MLNNLPLYYNLHIDPVPSFNFLVYIRTIPISFQKISSIEQVAETQTIQEGGENHYVHTLRAPSTKENTLVLENGLMGGNGVSQTAWWAVSSQLFRVGNRVGQLFIFVRNQKRQIAYLHVVHGLVLKKWSLSEMDAQKSGVLIERLEFSYQSLDRCIPASAVTGLLNKIPGYGNTANPFR